MPARLLACPSLDYPASPLRPVEARTSTGEVRQALQRRGVPQILIRLPDGSVHTGEPITLWRPLVISRERLEWCAARSLLRGSAPLLVVAVRRRGVEGSTVGAAFAIHTKPTRGHAKEVALKYLLGRAD
jgi:hypothetical protein